MFFCVCLSLFFMIHFIINVGMNIGVLPVTGITLPFMSYGGSHLITEFAGVGILMGMQKYRKTAKKEHIGKDILES